MTHRTWGLQDGLLDQAVQAIAQTSDGYLWLGTPHGLVRFDGFKFVNFDAEIDPTLHEFGVSCLLTAQDGSLWIGSLGGGVTHLGSKMTTHYKREQGLIALATRALFQTSDGAIWAGTDDGLYELVDGRFRFVDAVGDVSITSIVGDRATGFWIAGEQLIHFTAGGFHVVEMPKVKGVIRSLAVDSSGRLWVGALGGLLIRRMDGGFEKVREINSDVRALCYDDTGRLWIGTIGDGLLVRTGRGNYSQAVARTDLEGRAVRALTTTKNGDLWVGTHAGLLRLSQTGMDFLRSQTSGISDFGSIFTDVDDSIWLSAGDLRRFRRGFLQTIKFGSLKEAHVRSSYREPSGAFWVGTAQEGAYRFVQGRLEAHILSSTSITGFLSGSDGSTWIGTDHGLANWLNGKLSTFAKYGDAPMSTVKAMALAGDGGLWLTTPSGLFHFKDGEYTRPEVAHEMGSFRVWSLYSSNDGSLWIGAGTGLYLWRNGTLIHIQLPRSPFQSQAIISILADAKGRFLIAEPATVFRISARDLEHSISATPAKPGDSTREVRLQTSPETFSVSSETGTELYGEMPSVAGTDRLGGAWYATYQGLLHIASDSLSQHSVPPPVTIERVLVDGAPVSDTSNVTLSASTHNFQVQASPILPSGNTGLVLKQRLFGLDPKWTDLTPGQPSSYGSLPPGHYSFEVEAYWPNSNAVSTAHLEITQESAVYRRGWFLASCSAFACFVVGVVVRYRIHQIRMRYKAVADERSRVAREIHDTLLQGCIGAVSLLEALEISYERAPGRSLDSNGPRPLAIVQCVREQLSLAVKEGREAIWSLRNADDLKPLESVLHDTLHRLTSRASLETSFRVEGHNVPLIPRVQHELVMATREAILNAVNHANARSVQLQTLFDEQNVTVLIVDDGIGFDPDVCQFNDSEHFGLGGMRDRMLKFRGSMIVESKPGRGTEVRLSLPLSAARWQLEN